MISPYTKGIKETNLPYSIWFSYLLISLYAVVYLIAHIITQDTKVKELTDELETTKKEKMELEGELEQTKQLLLTKQQVAVAAASPSFLYRPHNKVFVDSNAEVIGVQIYEFTSSLQNTNVVFTYHVNEDESYYKVHEPLASRSDSVNIPKRTLDELNRCYANNNLLDFIAGQIKLIDKLCNISHLQNEEVIVGHIILLRVATTLQKLTNVEPSFENPKVVSNIISKRRTGVVEGIVLNEILGDTTSYYFQKRDGAAKKKNRWYAAIKKEKSNVIHLITFNNSKMIQYEKVDQITTAYKETLKRHNLM